MESRRVTALLAVLAVAVLVPCFLGGTAAEDASESASGTEDLGVTMYGYVTNLSDQEENSPLAGVNVTLHVSPGGLTPDIETTTDSEGRFEFEFDYDPENSYYLQFNYPGYTVRSLPDTNLELTDDGSVRFTLQDYMRPDPEGNPDVYALTGDAYGPHAISMVVTTGMIYGTVYGDNGEKEFPLPGATVTVVSSEGMSFSATTDESGYYSIECPSGTYTLTAWCNGFSGSDEIQAESGVYTVILQQNSPSKFLGLDIAHATLVLGILVLALFILATVALHHRVSKMDSEPILLNDLAELERSEDDEIKHP